jgi:hypothetical protein
VDVEKTLREMQRVYRADPETAVRGQEFIRILHRVLAEDLRTVLSEEAVKRGGVTVKEEVTVFGSHKAKDVDVAVIEPNNGPLLLIGVRSQMSSVAKNALTYYEGIVGECISLQDRYPLAIHGYVYLHPLHPIKEGKEAESIDHGRYARLYESITGREGHLYKDIKGVFDQFAYMVVDFDANPPILRDDLVKASVPNTDLQISTFVDRMIDTFKRRTLFIDIFK